MTFLKNTYSLQVPLKTTLFFRNVYSLLSYITISLFTTFLFDIFTDNNGHWSVPQYIVTDTA